MQIAGSAVRIKSALLRETLHTAAELRLIWNRYVLIQGLQVAQIAACNRLHEIEQRLARWLLMCQDRVDAEILLVTHEFLAQMLGTGRPSVSLAAGILQRGGLIENVRGAVTILDRPGLEAASCECYFAMQRFGAVSNGQVDSLCLRTEGRMPSGQPQDAGAKKRGQAELREFRSPTGMAESLSGSTA
jgi:hypothetical protein